MGTGNEQGRGQAQDVAEDSAVELGSARVLIDLVEGSDAPVEEEAELALGLVVLPFREDPPPDLLGSVTSGSPCKR